jgi:hypothetical protein
MGKRSIFVKQFTLVYCKSMLMDSKHYIGGKSSWYRLVVVVRITLVLAVCSLCIVFKYL